MDIISRLEEAILVAIWKLGENAYGVSINREVSASFKKSYSMGALYFSFDQLLRKKLVSKFLSDPTPQRGGRGKTYYRLTDEGKKALEAVREHQRMLWKGISETAFKSGTSK